ncbi:MAG: GIY-YIG nuclease family protein [Candidatus Eisenbacteria bacterium]
MSTDLRHLRVLLIDCQTTGSNPDRHHLLEVGWRMYRAVEEPPAPAEVESCLVRLPEGEEIPRAIVRLTGIRGDEMAGAMPRRELAARISSSAEWEGGTGEALGTAIPAVAHYARFEQVFLAPLWGERPPHPFYCTHEIARRLFPDLPRRGLRALAGFFGDPLPEMKRSAVHVAATARVWSGLVERLRTEAGVRTAGDLDDFLRSRPLPRGDRFAYPLDRAKRLALPDLPGVYRFLGGNGGVLYVGKAASLKSRVNSYYRKRRAGERHLEMVTQARDVEVTVTASPLEAALLEAEEIGRRRPPYNRAMKNEGVEVWFFSGPLDSARPGPDPGHATGPFPDRATPLACGTLRRLLSEKPLIRDEAAAAADLGIRAIRIAPGAIRTGLRLFGEETLTGPSPGTLLAAGTKLWREKMGETVEEEPGREEEERSRILEGEDVAALLGGLVVRTAHLVRRARWFALLGGAVVRWEPDLPGPAERRELALSPDPVSNRGAYDRLRVLTTEIRRLVGKNRPVEVTLSSGVRLGPERLRRLLRMV